ncbi:MAG TPA: oligosaccharide flippase family protein, partial [Acidiferrobacteraceae bacterium]|nr:oligosaccharide flippase family protein [Acidiferrobacteraceae bacterium]
MKLREIYGYTGVLYGANLLSSFVTFLVTILVTRHISRTEFGMYGVFQAYFLVFAYVFGLGISQATVKFVASGRLALAEVHTLLLWALGAIAVISSCGAAVLLAFGNRLAGLALLGVPAYQVYEVSLSYSRGKTKRDREALTLLGSSLLSSLATVLLLHRFPDVRGPVYGQLVGIYITAAVLVLGFLLGRRRTFARLEPAAVRAFMVIALPVYAAAALFAVAESFDRFVIRRYLGFRLVGEYVLALTFLNIVNKPIALLGRVLLSHFSRVESSAQPHPEDAGYCDIVRLNLFLLPVFALAVVGLLPPALKLLLTRDYTASFDIFAIISAVVVLKGSELVNSSLLIARRTPMTNVYTQLVALLVYVPVALILVHAFGLVGVAVAVVVRWV